MGVEFNFLFLAPFFIKKRKPYSGLGILALNTKSYYDLRSFIIDVK